MSFNTSFSTLSLNTIRFSFAFSCSSSQPPSLVHLQSTVLLAPTVVRLLYDLGFLARLRQRLAIRYSNLNLPQQVHDLLRCMLLASRHTSEQIRSEEHTSESHANISYAVFC